MLKSHPTLTWTAQQTRHGWFRAEVPLFANKIRTEEAISRKSIVFFSLQKRLLEKKGSLVIPHSFFPFLFHFLFQNDSFLVCRSGCCISASTGPIDSPEASAKKLVADLLAKVAANDIDGGKDCRFCSRFCMCSLFIFIFRNKNKWHELLPGLLFERDMAVYRKVFDKIKTILKRGDNATEDEVIWTFYL